MTIVVEIPTSSTLATAQPIAAGLFGTYYGLPSFPAVPTVILDGEINPAVDQDYYVFTAQAGDVLTIDVDWSRAVSDLQGFLYNAGGALVASNDDGGVQDPGSSTIRDPFITHTVQTSGLHYFGIQSSQFISAANRLTEYEANVSITSAGRAIWGTSGAEGSDGWMGNDTIRGAAQGAPSADTGGDTLRGLGGRDVLDGGGGDDALHGGSDGDRLLGGAGNDTLWGDDPAFPNSYPDANFGDVLSGGDGDDLIVGGNGRDTVTGGEGADTITDDLDADPLGAGSPALRDGVADLLAGGEGNDVIRGGQRDRLQGGGGDDLLRIVLSAFGQFETGGLADGGEGVDRLILSLTDGATPLAIQLNAEGNGQAVAGGIPMVRIFGIESLFAAGGSGADLLLGGGGADSLSGGGGADTVDGGAGDDSLEGGAGDILTGGVGNDAILVTGLAAALEPGSGNDTVTVEAGAAGSAFSTGAGSDNVLLGAADASVSLGAGNDTVQATARGAAIDAGGGNDRIELGRAVDAATALTVAGAVVDAGPGNDTIRLYGGEALVSGGSGSADILDLDLSRLAEPVELAVTGAGTGYMAAGTAHRVDWDGVERIRVVGGAGADVLEGGSGLDTLEGGGGADTMRGGASSDVFRIDRAGAAGDRVADFNGRGAEPGDSIVFLGFGDGGAVTALGGGAFLVSGSLGSATITVVGTLHPSDYVFAAA